MKKIILALACAVSVVVAKASDSDWFSGSASGTELTKKNAAWSRPDSGVEVAEGVITLDLDTNELMTLTPTETVPDADTKTSVNVTANFYPNALEDLVQPTDAQTALAVAYETEKGPLSYYAWNGSGWVALSGATPVEGATEVTAKIELDYYRSGTKARFTIEGTALKNADNVEWLPLATTSRAVNNVAFAGSGKLRSVASTVEIGVASVDGVKYPTYAAAIEAAKVDGVLKKVVTILRASADEELGAGALADYKAVDGKIVAKVYVAQIGATRYETLADAVADYTTGDIEVLVEVEKVGDRPCGGEVDAKRLEALRERYRAAWFDTLTAIEEEFDVKAENVAVYIKSLNAEIKALKAEEDALKRRRMAFEKSVERLKGYLLGSMHTVGRLKIDMPRAKLSVRKNAESLVVDDDLRFIEWAQSHNDSLLKYSLPEIRKTDAKKLVQAGEQLPFVHLTRTESLMIK